MAVPIGLDLGEFNYLEVNGGCPLSVSFIGSLDWMPNIEALNWFVEAIWPHLNIIFPALKLHVAGRNCPDWIRQLQSHNIIIEGEVEDSRTFLQRHPLTVVPLLSGSGMRAKIIEAMALGRVVITTTLGLEGINARDKHDVLIADTADEFIRKFRFCYHHQKHLSIISQNARRLIEQDFDHLAVARNVQESYQLYSK
jgi:glycosyltransferase involved in cell wall biosynthesis